MSSAEAFQRLPLVDEPDDLIEASPPPLPAQPRVFDRLSETGAVFNQVLDYEGATFKGPVVFRNCKFQRGFSFKNARFEGPVTFNGCSVTGARGNRSVFDGAIFLQSVKFVRDNAFYLASFAGTTFTGPANLKARYLASATFNRARFLQPVNFARATFNGPGNFREVLFGSSANFEGAEFRYRHCHARFNRAVFQQVADFGEVQFRGHADFTEAQFLSGATFHQAAFTLPSNGADDNEGNDAQGHADAAQGDLVVLFKGAVFQANAEGQVVSFEETRFGDHNFRRDVCFDGARFLTGKIVADIEPVSFRDVECTGSASFRGVEFGSRVPVTFALARFEGDLDLSDTTFGHDAIFDKSRLAASISLADTRFARFPDLRQATFGHQPQLYQCHLPTKAARSKRDRKDLLPRISALRRIASQTGDKKTELQLLTQELKLEGGLATRLYGIVSNYGQSWFRPALWLVIATLLLFPLLHLAAAGRIPLTPAETQKAFLGDGMRCEQGEGHALAAAIEQSMRTAIIVGTDVEQRSRRVSECLGFTNGTGLRTVTGTLLETLQTLMTIVLVFFIGQSIRRRLQLR